MMERLNPAQILHIATNMKDLVSDEKEKEWIKVRQNHSPINTLSAEEVAVNSFNPL